MMIENLEKIEKVYYDRHYIKQANCLDEINFFQIPAGQKERTRCDTNLDLNNQLVNDFLLNKFCVYYLPVSNDLEKALVSSGVARLYVGSKVYVEIAPIYRITKNYDQSFVFNEFPILLKKNRNFALQICFNKTLHIMEPLIIVAELYGIEYRPIC